MNRINFLAVFSLAAILLPLKLFADDVYGTVVDPEGSPLPGVLVTANLGITTRTAFTNAEGEYRFESNDSKSPEGNLEFFLEGFRLAIRPVGPQNRVDVFLSPALEEVIRVTSESPITDTKIVESPAFSDEFNQLPGASSIETLACVRNATLSHAATGLEPGTAPPPFRSQLILLNGIFPICFSSFGSSKTIVGHDLSSDDVLFTPDLETVPPVNLGPMVDLIALLGLPNMEIFPGSEPCLPWPEDIAGTIQLSRSISLDTSSTSTPPNSFSADLTTSIIDVQNSNDGLQTIETQEERLFPDVAGGTSQTSINRTTEIKYSSGVATLESIQEYIDNSFDGESQQRYSSVSVYDPGTALYFGNQACNNQVFVSSGGTKTTTTTDEFPGNEVNVITETFGPQVHLVNNISEDNQTINLMSLSFDGTISDKLINSDTSTLERERTYSMGINVDNPSSPYELNLFNLVYSIDSTP